jgi:hypothetical protein
MENSTEYTSWRGMKDRCLNPRSKDFDLYGSRGIKVCERWMTFENFYADMGPKPRNYTLERIDNGGNYEPSNCKWATRKEKAKNRRPKNTVRIDRRSRATGKTLGT